jgi:hypothetical protein
MGNYPVFIFWNTTKLLSTGNQYDRIKNMTGISRYRAVNMYPEIIVDPDTRNRITTPDFVDWTIKSA